MYYLYCYYHNELFNFVGLRKHCVVKNKNNCFYFFALFNRLEEADESGVKFVLKTQPFT